mmetsp:Transcript_91823/g.259313  ORF Transcript_91823/g.259313 Transcript_91823/m.259313 type:complete len:367 (-) Transcript_91823:83-1183(-)
MSKKPKFKNARRPAALVWGTSNPPLGALSDRPRILSSCSNTSAQTAGRSGPSSTSTAMAFFCRRLRAWCAVTVATPSSSSRSKRWTIVARRARSGRRFGCRRSQSRSTCTTSRRWLAIAASVEKCPWAGSWTSRAGSVGPISESCASAGQKMATRSGSCATNAKTGSVPSRVLRGKTPRRRLTWSTSARVARKFVRSVPNNCFGVRALHAATSAVGSDIQRWCPVGSLVRPNRRRQRLLVAGTRLWHAQQPPKPNPVYNHSPAAHQRRRRPGEAGAMPSEGRASGAAEAEAVRRVCPPSSLLRPGTIRGTVCRRALYRFAGEAVAATKATQRRDRRYRIRRSSRGQWWRRVARGKASAAKSRVAAR